MNNITIRSVGPEEVDTLADLAQKTFEATFAKGNDPADLSAYIEHAFSIDQMRNELALPDSHFFFVMVSDRIAGYLKVNKGLSQTENIAGNSLEVERIYVDDNYQNMGLGKALMDFVIEEARRQGCDAIWLGVWEDNLNAIAFYERKGFVPFGKHDFVIGSDVQTDILMRLPL